MNTMNSLLRCSRAACSLLLFIGLFRPDGAAAAPPLSAQEQGQESLRALMNYLGPVVASSGKAARVYYRAVCPPVDYHSTLTFPLVDVQPPSEQGSVLSRLQSIFRRDPHVTVTQDGTGMLRVRIGEPADAILKTPISARRLSPRYQFNPILALIAIESTPDVQSEMQRLNLHVHGRVIHEAGVWPTPELPHLPAEISHVTMDGALDAVAKTWGMVVFYGYCDPPATYDVFWRYPEVPKANTRE